MSGAPRVTVELRAIRLWPLPLVILWTRVGAAARQWAIVTPWGIAP